MNTAPIACTLSAGEFKERLAAITALNKDALRSSRQHDLTLELVYAKGASERVREFVAREQECCAFLTFDLTEDSDRVRLVIVAPEEARIAAKAMFAQFSANTSCGVAGCCA